MGQRRLSKLPSIGPLLWLGRLNGSLFLCEFSPFCFDDGLFLGGDSVDGPEIRQSLSGPTRREQGRVCDVRGAGSTYYLMHSTYYFSNYKLQITNYELHFVTPPVISIPTCREEISLAKEGISK